MKGCLCRRAVYGFAWEGTRGRKEAPRRTRPFRVAPREGGGKVPRGGARWAWKAGQAGRERTGSSVGGSRGERGRGSGSGRPGEGTANIVMSSPVIPSSNVSVMR